MMPSKTSTFPHVERIASRRTELEAADLTTKTIPHCTSTKLHGQSGLEKAIERFDGRQP